MDLQEEVELHADNVYVNVKLKNTGIEDIPAKFNQSRNLAYLDKTKYYRGAIVGLTAPSTRIPLFRFQSNSYTIGFKYNNDANQLSYNLVYINKTPYTPEQIVFTYQTFIDILNAGYEQLFNNYKTLVPGTTINGPPYVIYDADSRLITLYAEQQYVTDGVDLYMNSSLFKFFNTFDNYDYGIQGGIYRYKIDVKDNKNNSETINSIDYYKVTEEISNLANWFDVKSLEVSSSMPVRNESKASNVIEERTTLTDYHPNPSLIDRTPFIYVPSFPRWFDMPKDGPLTSISMNLNYVDSNDDSFPIMIPPNDSFEVKLLFRRKDNQY